MEFGGSGRLFHDIHRSRWLSENPLITGKGAELSAGSARLHARQGLNWATLVSIKTVGRGSCCTSTPVASRRALGRHSKATCRAQNG
jgi:hypothetical protein